MQIDGYPQEKQYEAKPKMNAICQRRGVNADMPEVITVNKGIHQVKAQGP